MDRIEVESIYSRCFWFSALRVRHVNLRGAWCQYVGHVLLDSWSTGHVLIDSSVSCLVSCVLCGGWWVEKNLFIEEGKRH